MEGNLVVVVFNACILLGIIPLIVLIFNVDLREVGNGMVVGIVREQDLQDNNEVVVDTPREDLRDHKMIG